MKKVVLISSMCGESGYARGTFGTVFHNLSAALDGSSGWKAHVVPGTVPRRMASGVKSPFDAPASANGGFRASLLRFKRILDITSQINACREKLAEYSGLIGGADVVHAHDIVSALAFARSGSRRAGPKFCVTPAGFSGLEAAPGGNAWLRKAETEALAEADSLMVPSRAFSRELDKAYGPQGKTYVVPPGLADEKHVRTGLLRRRLGVPDSALLAAAFYGPGAASDAGFFLEAFAAARKLAPGVLFGLIAGIRSRALEERVSVLGLEGAFVLLGPDAPEWDVLSESDIFFSSFSRPYAELGTLSAFRAGVAVVASDAGWNAEAAGHGEAALLFKSGDITAAGAALAEMAGQPMMLTRFSAKAREHFKAGYGLEALARRAAAVYSEMVASARTRIGQG